MTDNPLYICFLWHMPQPFYKDPLKGVYRLPWVRLHGTKDYLDMLEILTEFPAIQQVFNFTPSLLEQLEDYTGNNAKDRFLELTLKKASELSMDDKVFILENFFLANFSLIQVIKIVKQGPQAMAERIKRKKVQGQTRKPSRKAKGRA